MESCITPKTGVILRGQVLAVGVKNGETIGLTSLQKEIVASELFVFNEVDGILTGYRAVNFLN